MTAKPWRYRCPEGHSSIDLWVSRFYCHSCGTSYPRDDLQDLAA